MSDGIYAPYNFVPLSPWVFSPEWKDEVSQDIPCPDGLSGVLAYVMEAHSPLLVGGEQTEDDKQPGRHKVPFFRLPNGELAIPGSSVRGMIRNVLEIAAFGKMRLADDKHYGLRDISGPHVKEVYRQSLFGSDPNNPHPLQAGFLRRGKDDSPEIIPCRFTRVSHIDMEERLGIRPGYIFTRGDTVQKKYEKWSQRARGARWPVPPRDELPRIRFSMGEMRTVNPEKPQSGATNLNKGDLEGILVFTGQVSDRGAHNAKGKYKDFIFFSPEENNILRGDQVPDKIWQAFRFVHGDDGRPLKRFDTKDQQPKSLQGNYPWMDFWKERFFNGREVPVFFRRDPLGRVMAMGLAYMFKRACDLSIGDAIENTSPDHRNANLLDLPELLFGRVGEDGAEHDSLKGRVSFGLLTMVDKTQRPVLGEPTILNGPKPTYFPSYLVQDAQDGGRIGQGVQYSTLMDPGAQIRGWKRYPARPMTMVKPQALQDDQQKNFKVQTILETLPAGVQFTGKVRFHNLRPAELGAVLWALEWGGNPNLRHSLGMGRAFGYGQVSICIEKELQSAIIPNKIGGSVGGKEVYLAAFAKAIHDARSKEKQVGTWEKSQQVVHLLAMADATKAEGRELRHMKMGMKKGENEFNSKKQDGFILPAYVVDTLAAPRPDKRTTSRPEPSGLIRDCASPWVEQTIAKLVKEHNTKIETCLRGKHLAEAWQRMDDSEEKHAALLEIDRLWKKENIWAEGGKSLKIAKKIYQEALAALQKN